MVTHIGTVQINEDVVLHDVFYVPDFKFNLVSIPKICKDSNCTVVFTNNGCFLQSPSMNQLALGELRDGLYYLDNKDSQRVPVTSSIHNAALSSSVHNSVHNYVHSVNTKLWHLRLGHMPVHLLKHIKTLECSTLCSLDCICQICPQAKQTKNSFHSSQSKTTQAFELVHVDTWGPYRVQTHNGFKFFLTVVDDFTKMTWIFLMKQKSEAAGLLDIFANYVHTQFNKAIKIIRSDNAPDLCEGNMKDFYNRGGILHHRSCVNSPQ